MQIVEMIAQSLTQSVHLGVVFEAEQAMVLHSCSVAALLAEMGVGGISSGPLRKRRYVDCSPCHSMSVKFAIFMSSHNIHSL